MMKFKSLLVASLALLLTVGVSAEDAGTCPQEEVCAIPCPADNPTPVIGKCKVQFTALNNSRTTCNPFGLHLTGEGHDRSVMYAITASSSTHDTY
jgi:hypothetical protein